MTKYGMTDEQYEKVMKADALQSIYGLSDELSNFAFSISEKTGIPIDKIFSEMWYILCNNDNRLSEGKIEELILQKNNNSGDGCI